MSGFGMVLDIHLLIGLITGLCHMFQKDYDEVLEQAIKDNHGPLDHIFRNKFVMLSMFTLMGVFTYPTLFLQKLLKK